MPDSLPKQKKLISISQAAKILGVSIDTIRRWDKSGVLHSERPDGKNRYFSLDELEKHKSGQPLSISEAAIELSISATTLRRLETRGLIKPNRNNAGERVFDRDSIQNFLKSDYFLRKKQIKEKIAEPEQEEKELLEDLTTLNETQHLERQDPKRDVKNYSPEPTEPSEEIPLYQNLKPLQRKPEFLATALVFLLLLTFGTRNIMISNIKSPNPSPTPSVLAETVEIEEINPSPTPSVLAETIEISTASADIEKISTTSADVVEPSILTIKTDNKSASVNIRQQPTTTSEKIGEANDGDTFELVSMESGWYEVKLADGSTGFISDKFINVGETNNQ